MASGHANRANRPNTWLHRPATQREVLTCQPGAVHTWHFGDIQAARFNVRFWALSDIRAWAAYGRRMTRCGPQFHRIECGMRFALHGYIPAIRIFSFLVRCILSRSGMYPASAACLFLRIIG